MAISRYLAVAAVMGALGFAPIAAAKVVDQSEAGFAVAHTAQVAATPGDVWKMLRMPQSWWSKDHSWSGDAANFWLDQQVGGCFCENCPIRGAVSAASSMRASSLRNRTNSFAYRAPSARSRARR